MRGRFGLAAVILAVAGLLVGPAAAAEELTAILWRDAASGQETIHGLVAGLKEQGMGESQVTVTTVSAGGDRERLKSLVEKAVAGQPSAVIVVGAPAAQQALAVSGSVPVLFLNVFDPVGAKVISDWTSSGNNAVGVSNQVLVRRRMEYAQSLFPSARHWAVVASSDPDAAAQLAQVQECGKELGLLGVTVAQADTPEQLVEQAAALTREADLLFTVDDPLTETVMPRLLAAAGQKPVFAASAAGVEAGALAGVGIDYQQVGQQGAILLAEILRGAAPSDLASDLPERAEFLVNLKAARTAGVTIPLELLGVADRVIE